MTRTRCEVRFRDRGARIQWSERGIEEGEFYISPNPGEDVKPLARIASGGELSRIMLALKTLASTDAPGKTLIFDEVDAGIGGAVADVVGAGCSGWASGSRCSASRTCRRSPRTASTHYRIVKNVRGGRTVTEVARVSGTEREEELARMIGGQRHVRRRPGQRARDARRSGDNVPERRQQFPAA